MKHKAPQLEIQWEESEPFALVIQTAPDDERRAQARQKEAADRKDAEQHQLRLS